MGPQPTGPCTGCVLAWKGTTGLRAKYTGDWTAYKNFKYWAPILSLDDQNGVLEEAPAFGNLSCPRGHCKWLLLPH
eukprot:11163676-Lingulodinium_polyedra.AAC.1